MFDYLAKHFSKRKYAFNSIECLSKLPITWFRAPFLRILPRSSIKGCGRLMTGNKKLCEVISQKMGGGWFQSISQKNSLCKRNVGYFSRNQVSKLSRYVEFEWRAVRV